MLKVTIYTCAKILKLYSLFNFVVNYDMSRIFYDAWNLFCFQVEKQLRLAYKAAEGNYKRSQSTQHQNAVNETIYRE